MGAFTEFEVTIDDRRLHRLIDRFPKKLAQSLRPAMDKAIRWFKKYFIGRRLSGRPGLRRTTGDLIRSFVTKVSPPGTGLSEMAASLASRSKYAAIHEYGGRITPKKGAFLTIPLKAAKTAGGALKAKYLNIRSVPNTFINRSKAGNLIIFEKVGKGIVPLFVLKREVTIKKRLGLHKMFRRLRTIMIKKFLSPAVEKAWRSGHQG